MGKGEGAEGWVGGGGGEGATREPSTPHTGDTTHFSSSFLTLIHLRDNAVVGTMVLNPKGRQGEGGGG